MKRLMKWLSNLFYGRRRRWVMEGDDGTTWETTVRYTKEEASERFFSKPIRPV